MTFANLALSRPLRPVLPPRGLLDVGREVRDLLYLPHLDDVAVLHGGALGPFDRFGPVNGPSVTVALPPENLTRAPVAGGCSPSSVSTTPALVSDSLYLVILATRSAGGAKPAGAFSYPLGITSIMNRMVVSSSRSRFGNGPVPGIDASPARPWRRGCR